MDFNLQHIPLPVAFALIALIGYMVGRKDRSERKGNVKPSEELQRTQIVAMELEKITSTVRKNLPDAVRASTNSASE
jgi:hypothetical protein